MATKIRLARFGAKKRPFYRVVVADSNEKRDGKFIKQIGTYAPLSANEAECFNVDETLVKYWLAQGAQPTLTVKSFLRKAGLL